MLRSINPFDQSVVGEFQPMDASTVQKKLDTAGKTFQSWKRTTFAERATLMQKAAALLKANKEEYARTITLEMGKVIGEARAEIEKSAGACEFFANNAEKFLADEIIATDARRSLVSHHPTGAILAVMPWNFPFW